MERKRWRRFDELDRQVCVDRYRDYQSSDYDAAQRNSRS